MTKLLLIRGLPGSGKSTLAKEYVTKHGYEHYEADMFFLLDDGAYAFDPKYLPTAHKWCKDQTQLALIDKKDVVVSNTFTRLWEMQDYFNMAEEMEIELEVIETKGEYENIHGVPQKSIDRMKQRWENINIEN